MEAFRPYGIIETAGSGQVALSRSGFVPDELIEASFVVSK
jgi:hypothetical protein